MPFQPKLRLSPLLGTARLMAQYSVLRTYLLQSHCYRTFTPLFGPGKSWPFWPCTFAPYTRSGQAEFLKAETVMERIERVVDRTTTRAFMTEAQERYAHQADRHRSDGDSFAIGDHVWVKAKTHKPGQGDGQASR